MKHSLSRSYVFRKITPLFCAVIVMGIMGCGEELVPFEGDYSNQKFTYFLSFKNSEVTISTPEGSITKPFTQNKDNLEVLYWDPLGEDTKLYFVQDELKMRLSCNECAKYNLPSKWELDVMGIGRDRYSKN
ncbi:hypothetical protein P7F88_21705 [Vibrio hannami]|uniref:hypothetical protein n=1 Tax=Vibrio hannami TaxID=2717094 RepID=UPI00240F9837|nr:hypothetical protein [Vibrio hannami]MDG3088538.1 hypothetical protein [Vibrio hannami]